MNFHTTVSPDAFVCDENGQPLPQLTNESASKMLQAAMQHQSKCKADAIEVLRFYFNESGSIDLEFLEHWLKKNQPLDRWFFVHLIEVAGQIFLNKSVSAHKAKIARSKNATARAWVLSQWRESTDPGQGKAAFARVYVPLVKKEFGLRVTSDTIARDWLPKTKK